MKGILQKHLQYIKTMEMGNKEQTDGRGKNNNHFQTPHKSIDCKVQFYLLRLAIK